MDLPRTWLETARQFLGNWFSRWPLRVQLAGGFAIIILVCVGAQQVANSRATLRFELADAREKQELLAANAALALDRHVRDAIDEFLFLASNPEALVPLIGLDDHMMGLGLLATYVLDDENRIAVTLPAGVAEDFPLPGQEQIVSLASGPVGTVRMSGVQRRGARAYFYFGTRAPDGRRVIGLFSAGLVKQTQERLRFGESGHAAVVDQHGRVIAHPDPAYESDRRDLSSLPIIQDVLAGRSGSMQFYAPALGADALAGYAAVPSAGWGVIVPQSVDEFHARAQTRTAESALVGAALLGTALLLSSLMARAVTIPIGRLTAAARRLAAGDFRPLRRDTGRLGGGEEVAVLENAFEKMVHEINDTNAELQEALQIAKRESAAKSQFLATMSHELRTPMNGVMGMLHILSEAETDPERRKFIEHAESSAELLNRLLTDILEYNKVENGEFVIRPRPFEPHILLEELATIFGEAARRKGLEFRLTFVPGLPSSVIADPDRLRQILFNVIGNAVKFTQGGAVDVGIGLIDCHEKGRALEIRISDTGIGMSPADQGRIFDDFHQLEAGYSRKEGGLGLGLAIVRRLLAAMGGKVRVSSALGAGTVFVIQVPVRLTGDNARAVDLEAAGAYRRMAGTART